MPEAYKHISITVGRAPDGIASSVHARPASTAAISGRCLDSKIGQHWERDFVCAAEYKCCAPHPSRILRQAPYCDQESQWNVGTMSKKVADIIVETLQSAGVKHCYGVVAIRVPHV